MNTKNIKGIEPELRETYFQAREKRLTLNASELSIEAKFPTNALVELTNSCNHACIFCKNADQLRAGVRLNIGTFEKFVSEAVQLGLQEIGLYATGEPFLTKDIEHYIKLAKTYGVRRVYLTTNGVLATLPRVIKCLNAGLDSIKFSINAANEHDYKLVHGHDDFAKVLRNVADIYNYKLENNISIQLLGSCVMIPSLVHSKAQHQEIFSYYFEDISYEEVHSQGGQAFSLPFEGKYISNVFGDIQKPTLARPCQMPFNRVHLTAEGYLTACCVDYNLDLVFGDLKTHDLKSIWNNDVAKGLRAKHLADQLGELLCDQCMNGRSASFEPLTEVRMRKKSGSIRTLKQDKLMKRFIAVRPV